MSGNPIRIPEGGGLTEPSNIDEVSVIEHIAGKDEATPSVVDDMGGWGHQYGYPGTGVEQPTPDAFTADEMRETFNQFAKESEFGNTVPIRNTAGQGRHASYNINGTMGPLLIAGKDQMRKKIVLSIASTSTNPIYYGVNASIQRGVGGDQGILFAGQTRTIEHTDDVYVVTDAAVTVAAPIVLSVDYERFEL